MTALYTTPDLPLAGLLQSVLSAAAIETELRHRYLAGAFGELPPDACWPQIWLLDERDRPRAERILAEVLAAKPRPGPPWQCAGCGEQHAAQFDQCWQCGARRED